ncbi:hypothetical protein [Streptomyces malaysiensis]|uniref:hypothetical protein n=1 Tax=Streptomyces malaysiensis TaxID=92644 RepID=UPI00368B9FC2
MTMSLAEQCSALKGGDYVTATGVDTRGHKVTRVGFMLWTHKEVKAQRSGVQTKAWRVFIGEKGADPTIRAHWVTMFEGEGSVELLTKDRKGLSWQDTELRSAVASAVIVYGGKGGKKSTGPSQAVKARVTYTDSGAYSLTDLKTGEQIETLRLQSRIWWAPMPADHYEAASADDSKPATLGRGPAKVEDNEHQDQAEAPAREWEKRTMRDFVSWGGEPRYFRFGGLAKRKAKADGRMVRVRWAESRHGANKLVDVHTNEVVEVVHSMSKVWAIPATAEEIENMPPLVELPDGRPDYSLPPEERVEPSQHIEHQDQEEDEYREPRKPLRSGVLFEGWLGERDESGGFKVWDNARRRIIGWLSADYTMFRPVGG